VIIIILIIKGLPSLFVNDYYNNNNKKIIISIINNNNNNNNNNILNYNELNRSRGHPMNEYLFIQLIDSIYFY